MRKSKILAALAIAATMSIGGAFALTGCGEKHVHSYSKWNNSDPTRHWKECPDDGEIDETSYASHTFTDDSDTTCNDCGYVRVVETPDPDKDKDDDDGDDGDDGDDDDGDERQTYIISGTVTAYGKALSGVVVTIDDDEYVTNTKGNYTSEEIEIEDSISVTFAKSGYVTKTLTIAKTDFSDNKATLNAEMNLTNEKGTISGTIAVPISGIEIPIPLDSATVKLGEQTLETEAGGEYSFNNIPMGQELTLTVTHAACEVYSEKVTLPGGQAYLSKDVILTPKQVNGIDKSFFDLANLSATDKTDFVHRKDTAMWYTNGDVDRSHGEGLCLHIPNNETKEDVVSAIYQKIEVTENNSKMMFRVRGFFGQEISDGVKVTAKGLLTVRVVDMDSLTVTDLKQNADDESAWYEMDSNGYIQYKYDLSAYKGKEIVIIIGAKQGCHNAVERIRFAGENEEWVLPYTTAADLSNLKAADAADIPGINEIKTAFNDGTWNKVGDQGEADQGWLLKDADYAEEGSQQLRVFAYKKLHFNGTGTIVVRARTFTNQNGVNGHDGQILPQLILRLIAEDGSLVDIQGNVATVDNGEGCSDFYFTLSEPLSGDYTFVVGMARGQRLAIESILFRAALIEGSVTGTVKYGGEAVEGAVVSYSLSYNIKGEVETNSDGSFELPIFMFAGGSVTLNVKYENSTESASKTITCEAGEFTNGTCDAGDIALSKTYLPGLTSETVEQLDVLSGTKFETKSIYDSWQHDGSGITKTFNEGSGFERATGKTDAAYYYAKFQITNDNKFMKGNWFIFNRGNDGPDQDALLQVKVITADGKMVVLPASKVFCGGRNVAATSYDAVNKTLIVNNIGAYTEGVYDLSAYVGQTITIIIQEVSTEVNKRIVTVSNEIAFQGTNFYAAGTISGVVKDASGSPLEGVSVSANGNSATTNANGEYSVDIAMNYGNSVTVTFAKVGYEANSIMISGSEIEAADGEKSVDDVTLTAAKTIQDIIEENMDSLTAVSGTTFGPADNGGASGWTKSSNYNVNRDICIPLGEYIYAKVNIDENHKYMKFNARDTDNQGSKMLVMVYFNGTLKELAPWRVYGTTEAVIEGNYLINNRGDGYNEGIYDFSEWEGKEIIIVIQTAACLDGKTNAYTQCNEIAFGSVKTFDKNDSTNYYEASDV